MRELREALEQMARAHGVREPAAIVRRYAGRLVGWPEPAAVRAVRHASSHNSRLPRVEQILERLNNGAGGDQKFAGVLHDHTHSG